MAEQTEAHAAGRRGVPSLLLPVVLLAGIVLLGTALPDRFLRLCLFRRITGIPCPTCGLVRSWRLLAQGHIAESWWLQPLGLLTFLLVAGWGIAAAGERGLGWRMPRQHELSPAGRRIILLLLAFVMLAAWQVSLSASAP